MLAPLSVLDYVVIHELCHLKEHNHGSGFWALVERACPDYRDHRRWLRLHGHELVL
jgi:predicted metal-dependent hydrolase